MTRRLLTLAAVLAAAGSAPAADKDALDLLYLSDSGPVPIRLHLTIGGRPLPAAWDQFADDLFAHLDRNKDDSLEGPEVADVPKVLALLAVTEPQVPAPRGTQTRAGLRDYLRANGYAPFRTPNMAADPRTTVVRQLGGRAGAAGPSADDLNKGLIGLLDGDKDGKLSPRELAAAADKLARLDADDDETVNGTELLRLPPADPFGRQVLVEQSLARGMQSGPGEFVLIERKGGDPALAKRILAKYGGVANGRVPKQRLTRDDLKLSADAFDALDQDGDGELDAEELARFGAAPPEVTLTVRVSQPGLGVRPDQQRPVEASAAAGSPVTVRAVQGPRPVGSVALATTNWELEVFTDQVQAIDAGRNLRERAVGLFKNADRDANGYVDMAESQVFFGMRNLYQLADADRDGMLFEKEVTALLDKTAGIAKAAAGAMATLDVADLGRGLYGVFDADADGRLSPRELKQMARAAETADRDGDGAVSPADILRRLRATIRTGSTVGQGGRVVATPALPGMASQPPPRTTGPSWYRKMDRNRDGDVSRREFLGTAEQFGAIDTDGDGLIDRTEAEATDKRYKDEPPVRKGG